MIERYGCWPLYRKLHLKDVYTYFDLHNKKFYYTWELDEDDKETIDSLLRMSPLSPSEVTLEKTDEATINRLYWR